MMIFFQILLSLISEAGIFLLLGMLLTTLFKVKNNNIGMMYVWGFLAYFSLFEIVEIPCAVLWMPLHIFSYLWIVLLVLCIVLLFIVIHIKKIKLHPVFSFSPWGLVLVLILLIQCLAVCFLQTGTADAAYYVANVTTSVYTDTLGRYSPYTGNILQYFNSRYFFSAFMMNNALWSTLTGLHSMIQSETVMYILNLSAVNALIYQLGLWIFSEIEVRTGRRRSTLFVFFYCLIQLFCGTIYTTGTFLYTRGFEGKALIGNISIPAILLCAVIYRISESRKNLWIFFFLTIVSGLCFSGSALLLAAAAAAGFLPTLLIRKRWKDLLPLMICGLPVVLYYIFYIAVKFPAS